jgi:hypothetical protein
MLEKMNLRIHKKVLSDSSENSSRTSVKGGIEFFLISALIAIGMRPILTTVVVADDLIGPFSIFSEVGPSLRQHLRMGYEAASYGHFNYLGQIIGAFISWLWLNLMLVGIRYSTIYFFTKFIVFVCLVYTTAAATCSIAQLWNVRLPRGSLRIMIAITMIATFQLHLVWSNDPVASYPMSGYFSVILGFVALWSASKLLKKDRSLVQWVLAPTLLLCAILYYEMNIALIPTIAVLATGHHLYNSPNRKSALRHLVRFASAYIPPVVLVLFLQYQNAPKSASYDGTAIALSGKAIETFGKMMVSSLPFSSWHLGRAWVFKYPTIQNSVMLISALVLLITLSIWSVKATQRHMISRKVFWIIPSLVTYWIFATAIQSATVKVQNEASKIGAVYNFYAVGSTVFVVCFSVVALVIIGRVKRPNLKVLFISMIMVVSCSQVFLNNAIQRQHFQLLPQSRNLLVSFSERLPIESRCSFLQTWLTMGWPTYYSNSMTTGLERSFLYKFNEPFCGKY